MTFHVKLEFAGGSVIYKISVLKVSERKAQGLLNIDNLHYDNNDSWPIVAYSVRHLSVRFNVVF